jgi:hypothetical protein
MTEPVSPGRWQNRQEAEAIIGPIRRVLGPRWGFRLAVYAGILPLYLLAFLVAMLFVFVLLQIVGVIPPLKDGPWVMLGPTAFLAFITGVAFNMLWPRYRLLGSRLLVGEGGVVEWKPTGGTLVRVDDLGTVWVLAILDAQNDGLPYAVYLALRHVPTGTRLYITNFYGGAEVIAQLLREKLAERVPGRWSDLARWQPRTLGGEITPASPGEPRREELTE